MPIAVAAMLTFLLAPLVTRLQRYGLHRIVAIIFTIIIAFSIITAIAWTVSVQVISLAEQLPRYEQTLRVKVRQLNSSSDIESPLTRAGTMVDNLRKELEGEQLNDSENSNAKINPSQENQPITVEIQSEKKGFIESVAQVMLPLLNPLATTMLIAIFVIAMLFQREDLRERVIQIISRGSLSLATEAIDEAAKRVSRYLFTQLLVNAAYGIPIGIGLYFIGVPNAFLWGVLATLLRFIPYLGPWIAAFFPILLAFAIEPGWSKFLMALGLFLVLELVSNNIIEPWLYGVSTGISNFALMVAAVFWTWLWGPVGLFLSTPMTVCIVVMGNYVPSLSFISVLLGSGPALKPHERLYQRMLAMDYDEMLIISQQYIKENDLIDYYDKLLIPALNKAEEDRRSGDLAEVRQAFILQNTAELLEELGDIFMEEVTYKVESSTVLLIPAKDDIDELSAKIFGKALAANGIKTKLYSTKHFVDEFGDKQAAENKQIVCICAVPPDAFVSARQLNRRLFSSCPGFTYIIGIWSPAAHAQELQRRLSRAADALVVTTMHDAIERVENISAVSNEVDFETAPIPDDEAERLQEINRLDLQSDEPSELFDDIIKKLANAFEVPIALVSIVDSDRQFWKAHTGLPEDLSKAGEAERKSSICGHVVGNNSAVIVEDTLKDKRFANNPFVQSRGIRFYAGVPLKSRSGHAVGSLCVIDVKPRHVTPAEVVLLETLASQLMLEVDGKKL